LERAHRLREELGPEVDLAAAIDEVMADARERLIDETHRSAVFGQTGWISFIAGALGGAIAGSAAGLPEAIGGAAGGAAAELARRGLESRAGGSRERRAAERRHYVLFRSAPDGSSSR